MNQSDRCPLPAATLYDHIRELQKRLFICVASLAVAGILVYAFYGPILELLRSPLGMTLYYNNPAGSFEFIVKICFMGALIIAMPIITYNIIMFVRPAFEEIVSLKQVLKITTTSALLAVSGAVFAFTCILPGTLKFFSGFQVNGLSALISADSYLNFVINIIITFVIVFQIPLLIVFIDSVKPLSPKKLFGLEKWVILGSLIVPLLTPFIYDLATSLLISLPIIALYNLSIVMVLIKHARIKKALSPNINSVLASEIILNDKIINNFADELASLGKTAPIQTVARTSIRRMDVKPTRATIQTAVEPATWFKEKQMHRLALNSKVRVFSDIRPQPRINRVLAS